MTKHYDNYLPIEPDLMTQMLSLLNIQPGEKFCDLGSGDGRVVIAAAQLGAEATGIEINSTLVQESQQNILAAGVTASIIEGDMYDMDLSPYDVVYGYLSHDVLRIMFDKYQQTTKPGNRFVMWCGYGTEEYVTARACYDCTYVMDEQEIAGKQIFHINAESDGHTHMIMLVTNS